MQPQRLLERSEREAPHALADLRRLAAAEPDVPFAVFELERPRPRRPQRLRRALRLGARGLRTGLVALAVYLFVFNLSVVRGSSMAPGIHDGDRILIDQVSYLFHPAERGDVVVLRYPLDPQLDYIKRVIGVPGDEIYMSGGDVWVNGERLAEPYVGDADRFARFYARVRPDHYFVLGDNRAHSSDSREFGQVPAELVRGKVDLRIWPPARIGTVD